MSSVEESMRVSELISSLERRYNAGTANRAVYDSIVQDLSKYMLPQRNDPGISGIFTSSSVPKISSLFDTTALQSVQTLAAGHMAWLTPIQTPWYAWEPDARTGRGDPLRQWLAECTDAMRGYMSSSNFSSRIHEGWMDRCAFGTDGIFMELSEDGPSPFRFDTLPILSYVIFEDEWGRVDTLGREMNWTVRQCVDKFGKDKVSNFIKEKYDLGGAGMDEIVTIRHWVYPRTVDQDRTTNVPDNMPFASVWYEVSTKNLLKESGYPRQPFLVSRFAKWSQGTGQSVWGWSPAWAALPDARQLNFLQAMMDALAEKAAFPPMLIPSAYEGVIDARARGVTYYDNDAQLPRTWQTEGDYRLGLDRVQARQKAIKDAFYENSLQMLKNIEREMTAYEVAERSRENLVNVSPTFARATEEKIEPLLRWVLQTAMEAGLMPPPPASLMANTGGVIPTPRVILNNRFSMALRQEQVVGASRVFAMMTPLTEMGRMDWLDNLNVDQMVRDGFRFHGCPAEWLLPEDAVEMGRQARAAAAQQQAQMEQMTAQADAAAKVGSIPADGLAGKAIAQMGQQPQAA